MRSISAWRAGYLVPGITLMLMVFWSAPDRFRTMRNDFLEFYVSAHRLGTPDLYNEPANRALRDAVAPEAHITIFPCRPPFQTMLLWPLLRLPCVGHSDFFKS